MFLNAALSTLVSRYSNETDIVIVAIANREQAELHGIVGSSSIIFALRSDG